MYDVVNAIGVNESRDFMLRTANITQRIGHVIISYGTHSWLWILSPIVIIRSRLISSILVFHLLQLTIISTRCMFCIHESKTRKVFTISKNDIIWPCRIYIKRYTFDVRQEKYSNFVYLYYCIMFRTTGNRLCWSTRPIMLLVLHSTMQMI